MKEYTSRIIPTRMGTSLDHLFSDFFREDHPHAYGDKPVTVSIVISSLGSSPRVWGQETVAQIGKTQVRIIPTRMGTRIKNCCIWHRVKDHPHAYGDKKLSYRFHKKGVGSSPRVWGQADGYCRFCTRFGIIPTRMGTRCFSIT